MNQEKKNSINSFLIIANLIIITIIAATLIIMTIINHHTKIVFYNIPEQQSTGLKQIIDANYKKKYKIITINDDQPLTTHHKILKKSSLLIAQMDIQTEHFAATNKNIQSFSQEILNTMPMTISTSIPKTNGCINYVPILYDMYQIDIHYPSFLESGIKNIEIWQDLETFANKLTKKFYTPLIIPFADDKELINIFAQVLETQTSPTEYKTFYNTLSNLFMQNQNETDEQLQTSENYETLIQFLQQEADNPHTATAHTIDIFKRMIKNQIIKPSVLTQNLDENLFYTNNQICGIFFTKLSDHRKIDRAAINNYKSIYAPSLTVTNNRVFSAYQYSAIQLKKDNKIRQLILNLSNVLQTELSTTTGLAPVQKNCQVPDHQSDDVRYWLAASNGPVNPLSCAIPSKKAQKQTADFIRNRLSE